MRTEGERQEAIKDWNKKVDFYDDYRPDYPEELIRAVIKKANLTAKSKVLEIGAGSGKATAQFADFGFEMICIEPGVDLAKKGNARFKSKNIEFIASRFEDYSELPGYFDTIISAQAFHWVEQPIGFEKCANTLKKCGCLALFWHLDLSRDDTDLDQELVSILDKYNGFVSCMPQEDYPERMESISSNITESSLFQKPEIIHFHLEKNFTADEYYNYMLTGNLFFKTDEEKKICREELAQLAEKYSGIKRNFTYELYLTQKI